MTIAEVAARTRHSTRQVRRWLAAGRLQALTVGGRRLVTPEQFDQFIGQPVKVRPIRTSTAARARRHRLI